MRRRGLMFGNLHNLFDRAHVAVALSKVAKARRPEITGPDLLEGQLDLRYRVADCASSVPDRDRRPRRAATPAWASFALPLR